MRIKEIGRIFTQRWFLGLIGVAACSIFIWVVGPLITIAGYEPLKSDFQRLVTILVLVLLWAIFNVTKQHKQKVKEDESIQTLLEVDSQSDKEAASEIDLMRERIEQAVKVVTKTHKGKRSLYDLPWYVLIGPPGTGKTTVLKQSGLEFPLGDSLGSDSIAGVGGTRHCDWWFANKAVLIDTAGRYTTQDSQEKVDSKAWHGFLGLLKKYRTQRPINGAIVTISLASVMSQTRTERSLHARAIKSRLQELKNQLGMQFPIYVLLTKMDLVAGFNEFFADLSKEERDDLFGFMFPREVDDERGVISLFNKEFHGMLERLDARMLRILETEDDLDKRALIFEFPKQLRVLQANLDEFLAEIFAQNSFEEPALIRGVFMLSSVQEGLPVDKLMNESTNGLGLNRLALAKSQTGSHSYFVKNLFDKVIFKEQLLGTVNRHYQKQSGWMRRGVYIGCTTLLLGASALWFMSYKWNSQLIVDTNEQASHIDALIGAQSLDFEADIVSAVETLDRLMTLPLGKQSNYGDADSVKRFGLYQGDKVSQAANNAYSDALTQYFAPLLLDSLVSEMESNQQHREYLYETLKTYLMLFNPDKYQQDEVLAWFNFYFERQYPGELNADLRRRLLQHTQYLLGNDGQGFTYNTAAVTSAREVLTQMSLPERAYQRMKIQFSKSHVPSFRLTDVLGPKGLEQFERASGKPLSQGISGFYTYNGFHSIFQIQINRTVKSLMEENWVYGDDLKAHEIDQDSAIQGVQSRYYQDYVNEWKTLIEDIQLKQAPSLELATEQARVLSGVERPIESLLRAIQKEVALSKVSLSENQKAASEVAGKVAKVKFSNTADRLDMYLPEENGFNVALPGKEVESHFSEILRLGEQDFDDIQQAMVNLRSYLSDLSSSGNNQKIAYKSILDGTVTQDVAASFARAKELLPRPFNQWLGELSQESVKFAESGSKDHLNQLWVTQVVRPYQRTIAGRYPFEPNASREVRLKDFKRFFGYGGTLDAFFQEYLEPFVDTSKSRWRLEKEIGVRPETLMVFQRAQRIRQSFFESDNSLRVEFGMKPVYLDQHITRFVLELGGQDLVYKHGPARAKSLSWPAGQDQTRIVFTPPESKREIAHTYEGEWGIFKLLDQSLKARPESRKDNIVMIDLKGNKVQLELIPSSAINPFWSNEMERFRCPRTL
ncbi:type VI secretion system membrane subunit TssM [Vibrio sp. Vb2110]|jgi:type VI secretion system protein ImpL|uniref:type VI secretion system membrane subunit TssM n=1 Tax=Vibrio TaxID=662 RepID=UPI001BD5C0F2|nr:MULTISPECIES: type VI secretion system membrane subunit TssM [Vibrio]EGR2605990.1 type VI secretion system membrane subunit TssM [Vibrio alginolyticus]EJX1246286.1 type VI secretion system membrane subunit TssM [Vibrio alginolyticus]MBS9881237.1 type VI secretion system membrane subunit TssM [Vibrio alginolyticus]MBT0030065.1 type VI secretion system membrane subunit TssM [Vibrio alginolyticus]MBT0052912.1 type VI secretion system membrane subunit TssM [Vibrio alginolyticus]